jgi:isoamylase
MTPRATLGEDTLPSPLRLVAEPVVRLEAAPVPVPRRLGVHLAGDGVDVGVVAAQADHVDLCLLDRGAGDQWIERRYSLAGPEHGLWHGHVPGVREGQHYGFRVHGRWDPAAGLRHNPAKLLLDPYARGVDGTLVLRGEVYGHLVDRDLNPKHPDLVRDDRDSAPYVPHGVVLEEHPWSGAPRPFVPWNETVVYEAHVKGLTKLKPGIPEELRSTYAGLAHPAMIDHFRALGVTTLELLPIQALASEPFLIKRGLTNYWGYNTLGFFAPEPSYATRRAQELGPAAVLDEVKGMVSLLHEAGIEVVLDVVYNHTAEAGADGPHLSWRGLDNTGYYLHDGRSPATYADLTGCGNTLDFRRSRVIQMTLDSLRYWVDEVGIDGFRFDLAVTLGRDAAEFSGRHPLLVALQTDPVLSTAKLIAEPWDLGPGGWRTGQFPYPLAEWNDRFRGAARTFWLSDAGALSHGHAGHDLRDLATRLAGSADLFGHGEIPGGRGPTASLNFVTAHDGFTLADLVSYDHKDNRANLEDNRDGTDDNRSWNHGMEGSVSGESDAAAILPLRRRSIRNLLGTLLLGTGTPMITAGDEMGRTQRGNNNAYCQDSDISWVSWDLKPWRSDLLATTKYLLHLRRTHRVLRADRFSSGWFVGDDVIPDLAWYGIDGRVLDASAWHDRGNRVLQMLRSGEPFEDRDALLVLNGLLDPVEVELAIGRERGYSLMWDSAWEHPREIRAQAILNGVRVPPGERIEMEPLSMRLYLSTE